MKKFLAILLCTLMLMGSAMAGNKNDAWTVDVSNLTVTHKGETVALSPTFSIQTGRDVSGCWAQIAMLLDEATILTGQLEYGLNDTLFFSVDGAKDALLVEGADLFLNQFGLTGAQATSYIYTVLNILDVGAYVPNGDENIKPGSLDAQIIGENAVALTLTHGETSLSAQLVWEDIEPVLPYDLSGKNVCRYTFREMFPGDGTDLPEVITAALAQLSADESIRGLMELFSGKVSL